MTEDQEEQEEQKEQEEQEEDENKHIRPRERARGQKNTLNSLKMQVQ